MILPAIIAQLAEEFGLGPADIPSDPVERLKAYALLLGAKVALSKDTVKSPPPVPSYAYDDGFREHMACVLSERWSLLADGYIGSIAERRYMLDTYHDGFLGKWTIYLQPREFGGDEYEDSDIRVIQAGGVGSSESEALDDLVSKLQEQVNAQKTQA